MVFKLFRRKSKKKEEDESDVIGTCPVCNSVVTDKDDYKTVYFQGNKYVFHKKCYRKLIKSAKGMIKGGLINI